MTGVNKKCGFGISFIISLFCIGGSFQQAIGQVYGCKDPQANNYNPTATNNDGSCTYTNTSYTPPVKVDPMNALLLETSGLQWAGGFLWSFNDGGGDAAIYKIDTLTSAIWQTVNLGGATNVDWEDIAFDGTHFYIGDFGNNANGARTDLKIYKFPLSAVPDHTTNPTVTIPSGQIEIINFTYADQAQPPVATGSNNTKFDCEAMIVDGGKIHLFSKNWVDNNTTHYIINNSAAGTYVAANIETLATNYLVTAADKSPGFGIVTLLGYQVTGFANHYMHILSDYKVDSFFTGNKRRIDLPNATVMGQGEGLTYRNATYGYISNEKFSIVNQKLRSFNISDFISQTVLPLDLIRFDGIIKDSKHILNWKFSSIVNKLKVQYSINGIEFIDLETFPNSDGKNDFEYKPTTRLNYYRLSWLSENNELNYSKVVFLKNGIVNLFSNMSVKQNGEINFSWNETEKERIDISLTGIDGRIAGTINNHSCIPGFNTMNIGTRLISNQQVIVSIRSNGETFSKLVFVMK